MADGLLQVLLTGNDIMQLDYVGTSLSQDFIAGLVVQKTMENPADLQCLNLLIRFAAKSEGNVRQALLLRFWALVSEHLANAKELISWDVGRSIVASIELHTEALRLPSSLQEALIGVINKAVDFACKEFPGDDVIISIGCFCSTHRSYIQSQWRLFDAPAFHLRTLCSYRDNQYLFDSLKANLALCEFAANYKDTPSELLRIVIYDTLVHTLKQNVERLPYLKSDLRVNLEKYFMLFSEVQLNNLSELCDQPPVLPSAKDLNKKPNQRSVRFALNIEAEVTRIYARLQKGESVEANINEIDEGRQQDTLEKVIAALKAIARTQDFEVEFTRTQFTDLLELLNKAELLDNSEVQEFQVQYYPPDPPKHSKPSESSIISAINPVKKGFGLSKAQAESQEEKPWVKVTVKTVQSERTQPSNCNDAQGTNEAWDPWGSISSDLSSPQQPSSYLPELVGGDGHWVSSISRSSQEEYKHPRAKLNRGRNTRGRPSRPREDNRRSEQPSGDLSQEIKAFIEQRLLDENDEVRISQVASRLKALSLTVKCTTRKIGSVALGLWTKDSPIDLTLMLTDTRHLQQAIESLTTALSASGSVVNCRQTSSLHGVLVQYTDKHLDIDVNVSFQSQVQVRHSQILTKYFDLDPRLAPLVLIVKYWARARGLLGSEIYSGYEWTLLAVNYCQTRSPPVIPSLQTAQHRTSVESGCDVWFDYSYSKKSLNQANLGELLIGFFLWYGVEVKEKGPAVIANVRNGTLESKSSEQTALIAITDPFVTSPLGTKVRIGSSQATTVQHELGRAYDELVNRVSLQSLVS
jgi:DNA polymerase sigma